MRIYFLSAFFLSLIIQETPAFSGRLSLLLDAGVNLSSPHVRRAFMREVNEYKCFRRLFSSFNKEREIMMTESKSKEEETRKKGLFSGSVPKIKHHTKEELIDYDLVRRVCVYTTPLSKETGLLKFPEHHDVKEKDYDFAVLHTPPFLHKRNILSGLNAFYDRREVVERPYEYPWYLNGYLLSRFKNNLGFRGTGFLIGDKYALTAKHCVFHDNEVSSDVEFLLGATATSVLKKTYAKRVITHDTLDLALLELNIPVGLELGWAGLREASEKEVFEEDFLVTISGYPGQKRFPSYYWRQEREMFKMEGTVHRIEEDEISYLIDTSRGQSGAGLWRILDGERIEGYGIHTTGTGDPISGNSGVRVNQNVLSFIEKHIM